MKIPTIIGTGFGLPYACKNNFQMRMPHQNSPQKTNMIKPVSNDTVSFTSEISRYVKKYSTLPKEIREVLPLKDAIDMFKDMERTASGMEKYREKIGKGNRSTVFDNPWLEGYHFIVTKDENLDVQTIYFKSGYAAGDAVWQDNEYPNIQIVAAA